MAENRPKRRGLLALLLLAEVLAAAIGFLGSTHQSAAQFLDDRFPFLEDRRRRYQQQQQYQQWNNQQYQQGAPREPGVPAESARAPAPRKPDTPPSINVMVFGDAMSEWLAFGLEEAFADTPEVGIVRKSRPNTGLIRVEQRGEAYDWPAAAREMLNTEKPDYVVIMLGAFDRRGIREAIKAPPRAPAGQKKGEEGKQAQGAQAAPGAPSGQQAQQQAAQAGVPEAAKKPPEKPVDSEAPPESAQPQQDQEQPSLMAPEAAIAGTVVREFRSEEWGELYSKRVDEMIGVLKARGVPVFWVGLPSVRGARATSEMVYLNDIYRGRAEKAGITYVDIWDGFVDESGNYNNYGPDFEGQTRRLRAADGANFTRAGARKLAHYVEREVRRVMQARLSPLATPVPQDEPEADTKAPPTPAAPGLPPRPIASPVMSLTTPRGANDTLLGATAARATAADSVATRVLVKGEPIEAPAGRADDFAWPRRDVVTATGVLPPDPVEPAPKVEQPSVAAAPTTTPGAPPQRQAAPRPRQQQQVQQQQPSGWQPWQRQDQPRQGGGLFGWFGGGSRW
ncbi:MAG TPA: DUF459 domain-containing protein [Xanthobacteraceae bacterium]|nr:DUF459 domain-containing protein [Xanthobacteraceae bacterium]